MKFALLCVMIFLGSSIAGATPAEGSSPSVDRTALRSIPIVVVVPSDSTEALVSRICAETDAIWKTAGITFDWRRVRQDNGSSSRFLEVTIDDSQLHLPERPDALGWIAFTPDGPGRSIHLSLSSTENLLHGSTTTGSMTIAAHEMLVGRALGRALAHELGHYLLTSRAHTSRGLMRATWPSDRFFAMSRQGLEISADEREAAVEQLLRETSPDPTR